jgi:hypothetical protein
MFCSFNPAAMARSDVAPLARSWLIDGMTSAARASARSLTALAAKALWAFVGSNLQAD